MAVCRWKFTNNGPLLKWLFNRTETINKCVWLQMGRIEMDSNFKTSGGCFQVFALVSSDEIGKKLILARFSFFQNSFDAVS